MGDYDRVLMIPRRVARIVCLDPVSAEREAMTRGEDLLATYITRLCHDAGTVEVIETGETYHHTDLGAVGGIEMYAHVALPSNSDPNEWTPPTGWRLVRVWREGRASCTMGANNE